MTQFLHVLLIVTVTSCTCLVAALNDTDEGLHLVDQTLQEDISNVPSEITGKPVDIVMEVFFTQMRSVATEEVDYTFYLYQAWMDPRLKWGNRTDQYHVIRRNLWHNIWTPDTYIENELKSFIHDISSQNKFIWGMPNGTIIYGIRLTATMQCKYGSMKFPTAYFTCRLKFRVHSHETRDVRLFWYKNSVEFAEDFAGDNIKLIRWEKRNCTLDRSSVIINSCLELTMRLEKNYGSTVLRTYLPSVFIIVVGWLNFWIDRKEVSARVKLGTLVLLAMITEEVGLTFIMPSRVSVSAVDVWFAVLLAYVTLVMIEFAVVHSIDRYQKKLKLEKEKQEKEAANNPPERMESVESISNNVDDGCVPKSKRYEFEMDEQPLTKNPNFFLRFISTVSTGKIEKYSRIIYFVSFLMFQAFYWSYYLTKTETVD